MTNAIADSTENLHPERLKEPRLPWRDWVLLPMLSLLTLCLILVLSERIAGRTYYSTGNVGRYCMFDDPLMGYRGIPNSVCTEKNPETPLIEYRFNSCGDRAGMECGPKPVGVYRIVLTGSSTAMGYEVSVDRSFAARLPGELSTLTRRKIEIYNEGLVKGSPQSISLPFNQLPASRPDLILWVLTPLDISSGLRQAVDQKPPDAPGIEAISHLYPERLPERLRAHIREMMASGSISDEIFRLWKSHFISSVTEHFLYESQSLYLKSFLKSSEATFLRVEPDTEWKERLRESDIVARDVEERAQSAGLPWAAVLVPDRAQAAMISMGKWPAGYDPYKLDSELRSIIVSHGGTYIDILPGFRNIPNPEQNYYPVDGHPDAGGHRIIADLLAKALTGGAIPELKAVAQPQAILQKGK
jgi:hypothetical protein